MFDEEARPIEVTKDSGCKPEPGRESDVGRKVAKLQPQLAKGWLDEAAKPGD